MRVLLLSIYLLVVDGLLYITKVNEKPFKLPDVEQVPHKELRRELSKQGFRTEHLPLLHFDKAEDPSEIMRLSLEFFEDYLNEYQLQEIILNSSLKGMISGKWLKKNRKTMKTSDQMKQKQAILQMKLGFLRAESLGNNLDRVVERIPRRLYRFISPLVAMASSKFKATIEGFGTLFYLTLGSISQLKVEVQAAILHTLRSLIALKDSPNRLFAAGRLLIDLSSRYGHISSLFKQRVDQFVGELNHMATSMGLKALEQKSSLMLKSQKMRISNGSGRVMYELPPAEKAFILPMRVATEADKQMLSAEVERASVVSQSILEETKTLKVILNQYFPILEKFIKLTRHHMKEGLNTISGILQEMLEHLFTWSTKIRDLILPYNLHTQKLLGFEFDMVDAVVAFERFLVYQYKVIATAASDIYSLINTSRIISTAKADALSTVLMIVMKLNEILPGIIKAITAAASLIQSRSSTAVRDLFGAPSAPKTLKQSVVIKGRYPPVKFGRSIAPVKQQTISPSSSDYSSSSFSSHSSSSSSSSADSLSQFLFGHSDPNRDDSTSTRTFISTSDVSRDESSS